MKGLGNDEQICYIEIHKQKPYNYITYYEEKRNFWGTVVLKEGFYMNPSYFGEDLVPFDTTSPNILINNKIALEKSHITIEFSNGRKEKIYFNTDEDMHLYIKREFQGRIWREFESD